MAGFGEPFKWTRDRLAEASNYFSTLSNTTPDVNLEVDAYRDSLGQLPSLFSQSAMGLANYARSLFPDRNTSSIYDKEPQYGSSSEEMAAGRAVQMGQAPEPERGVFQGLVTSPEYNPTRIGLNLEAIRNIIPESVAESVGAAQMPQIEAIQRARETGQYGGLFTPEYIGQSMQAQNVAEAAAPGAAFRAATTPYLTTEGGDAITRALIERGTSPATYLFGPQVAGQTIAGAGFGALGREITGALGGGPFAQEIAGFVGETLPFAPETIESAVSLGRGAKTWMQAAEDALGMTQAAERAAAPEALQVGRAAGEGRVPFYGGTRPGEIPVPLARPSIVGAAEDISEATKATDSILAEKLAFTEPNAIQGHLNDAAEMVRQDKPAAFANFTQRIPVVSSLYKKYRPGIAMSDDVLTANIAADQAKSSLMQRFMSDEYSVIQGLSQSFGNDAVKGGNANVKFIGNANDANVVINGKRVQYPGLGTIKDIADRPELYDLSPTQRAAIESIENRNEANRFLVNQNYNAEINRYPVKPGGAHLPTVDKSESAVAIEELAKGQSLTRPVAAGASKERVFESGFDRWVSDMKRNARGELTDDQVFVPETNVQTLIRGLDDSKVRAASGNTFREGLGGKTKAEVIEEIAPNVVKFKTDAQTAVESITQKIDRLATRGYVETRETKALQRQIDQIQSRIDVRGGAAARGNQYLQRRLENLLERLDKAKAGGIDSKVLQNRIDSIGQRVAEMMDSEKLDPNAMPEFTKLNGDLDKAAAILDAQASVKGAVRDERMQQLRKDLVTARGILDEARSAYNNVNPRGYQFVQEGIYKYFPAKDAADIKSLLEFSNGPAGRFLDAVNNINAAVLSGDFSPILGQQGQIAILTAPVQTTKAIANAIVSGAKERDLLKAFRMETLAEEAAKNPQWERHAGFLGFSLRQPTPEEISGGWIGDLAAKFPKGEKYREANERLYSVVRLWQMRQMDQMVADGMRRGLTNAQAEAAAADIVTKIIPTSTSARLGQSQARSQLVRAPFTSATFITKPISFTADMMAGLAKMATPGARPTERQRLAAINGMKMWGDVLAIAATSQMFEAARRGEDAEGIAKAGLEAINPSPKNRKFAGFQIPGTDATVPLGGPFRAVVRAISPATIETPYGEVPVPFWGAPNYVASRVQPIGRRVYETFANKPIFGKPGSVYDKEASGPVQLLQAAEYIAEGTLPLGAVQPLESWRQGQSLARGIGETIGQIAGTTVQFPFEPTSRRSSNSRSIDRSINRSGSRSIR